MPENTSLIPTQTETATPTANAVVVEQKKNMSLKEKIVFSALGVAGVIGVIFLGKKVIENHIADKEQAKSFEDGSPETLSKQIKMAFENDGWPGTNTNALRDVLMQIKSKAEMKKVYDAYKKQFQSNLYKDMSSELQSTEYNEMIQIVDAKPDHEGEAPKANQYKAWAKRLKAAFDKSYGFLPGTDADAIKAVFRDIPTQSAFVKVGVTYKQLYGTNLIDDMKAEAEFGQYDEWMLIIVQKKK